jgi:hypothetical protein
MLYRCYNVNPGLINSVYGCLVGRVPLKYQIVTIGGVPPLIDKPWFINPGLQIDIIDRYNMYATTY